MTRTSSTPPASPSTRTWVRADLIGSGSYSHSQASEEPVSYPLQHLIPEWHYEALCATVEKPDEIFFGEDENQGRTSMTVSHLREVKAFCKQCPVFVDCLTHALTTPERHGIWAGTSKRTRMRILDLIARGKTTVETVVGDYLAGREKQYESIRTQRDS